MNATYQLVTLPSAHRALKKLARPAREQLIREVKQLAQNPYLGEQLAGKWRYLRSFHMVFRRTHYRVLYQVDEQRCEIVIRYADTRENFYRMLKQLKL